MDWLTPDIVAKGGFTLAIIVILETAALVELWRRLNRAQEARLLSLEKSREEAVQETKRMTETVLTSMRLVSALERAIEVLAASNSRRTRA